MEYKYHPLFKHIIFFIIIYAFLRHQRLMNNEHLILNSFVLTLVMVFLDHMFIHGHISPLQSLSEQYIDEDIQGQITEIKAQLKETEKKEKENLKRIEKFEDEENIENFNEAESHKSHTKNVDMSQENFEEEEFVNRFDNAPKQKFTVNQDKFNNERYNVAKPKVIGNMFAKNPKIMEDLDNYYNEYDQTPDYVAYNS
jgi:hypothetical protein